MTCEDQIATVYSMTINGGAGVLGIELEFVYVSFQHLLGGRMLFGPEASRL